MKDSGTLHTRYDFSFSQDFHFLLWVCNAGFSFWMITHHWWSCIDLLYHLIQSKRWWQNRKRRIPILSRLNTHFHTRSTSLFRRWRMLIYTLLFFGGLLFCLTTRIRWTFWPRFLDGLLFALLPIVFFLSFFSYYLQLERYELSVFSLLLICALCNKCLHHFWPFTT